MALEVKDTIYVVIADPVNRQQKRIAQKEYEKIEKSCMPIVLTYLEEKVKTDDLRLWAKEEYIKWAKSANTGNKFIKADLKFFDKHFPTKEQIKEIIKPKKSQKYPAYAIVAIVLIITLLCFLLR